MRWVRRILKGLLAILLVLLLAVPFFITTVNRTPVNQTEWYARMQQRLDSLARVPVGSSSDSVLLAGWARVNITPAQPVPTAGYGKRQGKLVSRVHDSLFVRAIWLQQGNRKAAIVSADLLIIPPEVTELLRKGVSAAGISWNDVFIGATHTHNSMGGWGKRYIGQLFAGTYNQELVNNLVAQIIQCIYLARRAALPSSARFSEKDLPAFVNNRVLGDTAAEFSVMQSLHLKRNDGIRASLHSFAAHATTLSDTVMQLSADYPGLFSKTLEENQDFAMFMAGAVGSMGPVEPGGTDWAQLRFMANGLAQAQLGDTNEMGNLDVPFLRTITLPLEMREPQWRIAKNWRFRPWMWSRFYGNYPMEVKALMLGNLIMVGMPCDFGGELILPLHKYAASKGKHLLVTSFNGGYCGYITPDNRYDMPSYETRIMNWFGPGNAAYFDEIIRRLVESL